MFFFVFLNDLGGILQLSEFLWTLRSSVLVVFNNFLHIDATDKSRLVAFIIDNFATHVYTPFHFLRTLSLITKKVFKHF